MLFADRIDLFVMKSGAGEEKKLDSEDASIETHELMEEWSFLGPQFCEDSSSRSSTDSRASISKAESLLRDFQKECKKLYKPRCPANREENWTLKKKFDENPMTFWGDTLSIAKYGDRLVDFATWVFIVRPSSASPERTFSRMKFMVSPRRSSITADHTDMRLAVASLLPQKRKLQELMKDASIKRNALFKKLRKG